MNPILFSKSHNLLQCPLLVRHSTTLLSSRLELQFFNDSTRESKGVITNDKQSQLWTKLDSFKSFLRRKDVFSVPRETYPPLILTRLNSILVEIEKAKISLKIPILERLANLYSEYKNSEGLELVIKLYLVNHSVTSENYYKFVYHLIKYIGKIDNYPALLKDLKNNYENHEGLRGEILKVLNLLVVRTVSLEGRANMCLLTDFVLEFSQRHQEGSLLGCLWLSWFYSEWFDDHHQARKLLQNHVSVQNYVQIILPQLVPSLLHSHDIDRAYLLLEMCLETNLRADSQFILRCLFDYYYQHGYLKRCEAVVQCCSDLGLTLTLGQQLKTDMIIEARRPPPVPRFPLQF